MFASITSQIKASVQGSGQQPASQYAPTSQQTYNNAPPQLPAPWIAQWSSSSNCWLYVNSETGESSWVNPSQIQPQPHHGDRATAFSPPPQQQWQPNYQNTGFSPPPQQQQSYPPYSQAAFQPPPQQQSQFNYQQSPFQAPPQQAPQTYAQTFFQPPQQQQSGFQRPPTQQYHQGMPQNITPAKKSHTGRNIALGLGGLVAGVVGVDMFMDSGDNDDTGGGSSSSGNDSSSAGFGDSSNYDSSNYDSSNYNSGNYNSGNYDSGNYDSGNYDGGNYDSGNYDSGNYNSTSGYGGDAGAGGGSYDPQAALQAQTMVDDSVAAGIAAESSAIF